MEDTTSILADLDSLARQSEPPPGEAPGDETSNLGPGDETPNPEPPSGGFKRCRHCNGEYAEDLPRCPSCNLSQRGAPRGPRKPRRAALAHRSGKNEPPSDDELLRAEEAIGQTFAFVCEDIFAPRFLPRGVEPPPFGDKRSEKLGIILAPVLAPLLRGPFIMGLIAVVVCGHAVFSYFREVRAMAHNLKSETKKDDAPAGGEAKPPPMKAAPERFVS